MRANLEREGELLAKLDALLAEMDAGEISERLAGHAAPLEGRTELAAQCARLAAREVPVRIAVVGDFSAGKSSFINSLLQDAQLCPEHDDPTTSWVTTFSHAARKCITLHKEDGGSIRLNRAQYRQQVQHRAAGSASAQILRFSYCLPHPLLKGVELLDTPGFNNPRNANDSEVTAAIMSDADAFLYLVDANGGTVAESGLERLRQIRSCSGEAPIYLLLSKADRKAPPALQRIKAESLAMHADLFGRHVYSWSSLAGAPRQDIDGHAAVTNLFGEMRKFKQFSAPRDLLMRLRQHQDRRRRFEAQLRHPLTGLVATHAQIANAAEQKLATVRHQLQRLQGEVESEYRSDVDRALKAYLSVKEIKGTGFFFCDAEIVLNAFAFEKALATFRSVASFRERLLAELARHFKTDFSQLRNEVEWRFKTAAEVAAGQAVATLNSIMGDKMRARYGTDVEAQRILDSAMPSLARQIGEAMWRQWSAWLHNLSTCLQEDYVGTVTRRSRHFASQIDHIMQAYQALVAEVEQQIS